MEVRRAVEADRPQLAALAAELQRRPDRHVAYLGTSPDTVAAEMIAEDDDWTSVSAIVVDDDGDLEGWLMGSVDADMGRVWWFGPFVDPRADAERWAMVVDVLFGAARHRLPAEVSQEELAPDARFELLCRWADANGFGRDPGSLALDARPADIEPPTLDVRPLSPADASTVAALHDRLFPGTHTTGSTLIAAAAPDRPRLVVDLDGTPAGYVAVERQPDGSGYVDFLGVDPRFRGRGLGAELVRGGVAALADLGCTRCSLTVRDDNHAARRLYAGLGFVEERVIVPYRLGFSIA